MDCRAEFKNDRAASFQINFLKTHQFAVISYKDQTGSVWVTFLSGEAGFVHVLDEQKAEIRAGLIAGEFIGLHEPQQIGF
ncbi:hypothetical protein SAMN05518855_1001258 [Paenibacillus sp. CF384]|nr:hypothetical protein SAMN05518855_1001258 [Paenibacillus sp. CF384]